MQKEFDWKKFKNEKIAVHCKTEEEAKDFCRKMHERGMRWRDGECHLNTFWDDYKEKTCYTSCGGYTSYNFYEKNNYTILEWSDYMRKEFAKSDLEDGMIVEYRNGKRRLLINNMLIGKDGFYHLNNYSKELKEISLNSKERDIVKVFKVDSTSTLEYIFDDESLELIWERNKTKRMTIEEMRKKLEEFTGEKIEIKL